MRGAVQLRAAISLDAGHTVMGCANYQATKVINRGVCERPMENRDRFDKQRLYLVRFDSCRRGRRWGGSASPPRKIKEEVLLPCYVCEVNVVDDTALR